MGGVRIVSEKQRRIPSREEVLTAQEMIDQEFLWQAMRLTYKIHFHNT